MKEANLTGWFFFVCLGSDVAMSTAICPACYSPGMRLCHFIQAVRVLLRAFFWSAAGVWGAHIVLGAIGVVHAGEFLAQDDDFLVRGIWGQIQDALGIPVLLAFAMSMALFFVLARGLRREIERRIKVEVESEVERARLNAILNKAGVGVMLVDRQHRLVDVNYRWCSMFDYRRREVRGRLSLSHVCLPDDLESVGQHFLSLFAGRVRTQSQEYRLRRKDGALFWGLVSLSIVDECNDERKWVVAMVTDIDAQKNSERALRESEERLRFITENTLDAVWQLDANGRVTWVNGADERMRGQGRDEVIGARFRDLICPDGYATYDRVMRHGSGDGDGRVIRFEIEMCRQDGSAIWAEANFQAIRGPHGNIEGYIGVTRDASHHRALHDRLREETLRDPLTGLFNRRFLDESFDRELARARRDNLPLALLMIDIDHFKQLNDTYGHPAGDEIIRRVGRLIQSRARSGDLPCRYGGEEFLLVLPNMTLATAVERAEEWRVAFANDWSVIGNHAVAVTVSIGVAVFPCHGGSAKALIEAVDQALYAAKRGGRNRVVAATAR